MDESADTRRILTAVRQSDWKRPAGRPNTSMVGHYEELGLLIVSQLQCGRCRRAGTGQANLEVIGSKQSYAVNRCKSNNDDVTGANVVVCNARQHHLAEE